MLSDCEKIKCTPLPLSYSRHSSRFFTLFSFTVQYTLYNQMPLSLYIYICICIPIVLNIKSFVFELRRDLNTF